MESGKEGAVRTRDNQRARLYRAEGHQHMRFACHLMAEPPLKQLADLRAFVERLHSSPWWRQRFGGHYRIDVRDGRGRQAAGGWRRPNGTGVVTLPRWARNRLTVLHELAHAVQPRGSASHGPEFCRLYLDLVRRWMGPEFARRLRTGMRAERVRVAHRAEAYGDHVGPLAIRWRLAALYKRERRKT